MNLENSRDRAETKKKIRSYCLIQLKSAEPRKLADACKTFLGIYGVVAATAMDGLFDVIIKIEGTSEEAGRALDDVRAHPETEFATAFRVTQIYASESELITKSAIFH
jgi:hypothetical protein